MKYMSESNFLCSWSGGKDSCYALHKAVDQGDNPLILLNVLNEYGERSRSHGIPKLILQAQADALAIPIHFLSSTWEDYESNYIENLKSLKQHYSINTSVFGDIDIQSHRDWEEKVSRAAGLIPQLPLWQQDRKTLVLEMVSYGIEAIITSCNQDMGPDFLGRKVTVELIEELEDIGIDPCGENGEYHTVVTKAPLFNNPIKLSVEEKLVSSSYNFAGLKMV